MLDGERMQLMSDYLAGCGLDETALEGRFCVYEVSSKFNFPLSGSGRADRFQNHKTRN